MTAAKRQKAHRKDMHVICRARPHDSGKSVSGLYINQ